MAEISFVKYSQLNDYFGRIDAEFYKPTSLSADKVIKKIQHQKLGNLVKDGYRVVYANTKILQSEKLNSNYDARFLQSTNISNDGLWIEVEDIGFVNGKDWDRYPKGRIKKGELLIEVKGQAEKVTIVQDYVPERTLVTGTLFKLSLKPDTVSHEYLFAFFSSNYGKVLRDRTKVNTLIAYVSKPELYKIPIPLLDKVNHNKIKDLVKDSYDKQIKSKQLFKEAINIIEDELQLKKIVIKEKNITQISFSDIAQTHRIDAQCYKPEYLSYEKWIQKNCAYEKLGNLLKTTIKGTQKEVLRNGSFPYVSIKDIDNIEIKANGFCDSFAIPAEKEDLLLAITGATIGKVGLVFRDNLLGYSGDLLNIKVDKEKISPFYLIAVLKSKIGQKQFYRWITGATNGHLSPSDVRKVLIPRLNSENEKKISNLIFESLENKIKSEKILVDAISHLELQIKILYNSN